MRNFVAKHDFNRASVHQDKSKLPPVTVEEGLLDYLAENAEEIAQQVYEEPEVNIYLLGPPTVHVVDPSKEEIEQRILRVDIVFKPTSPD